MADLITAKKIYRIFSWVSLAGFIIVIILVLRKSPPPDVPYDPPPRSASSRNLLPRIRPRPQDSRPRSNRTARN